MKHFYKDDKKYTWGDVRKNNPRILYWVIFPQGIEEHHKKYSSYSSMMVAKTFKKAWKLFYKYNGSHIERMVQCDLGRWMIKSFCRQEDVNLSDNDLFDKYAKLPKIVL